MRFFVMAYIQGDDGVTKEAEVLLAGPIESKRMADAVAEACNLTKNLATDGTADRIVIVVEEHWEEDYASY